MLAKCWKLCSRVSVFSNWCVYFVIEFQFWWVHLRGFVGILFLNKNAFPVCTYFKNVPRFESQIRDWILLPLVTPKRGVLCVIFILQFETWPISLSLGFYVLYYRNYLFSTEQIKKILNKFWIVESFDTTVSICHLSSSCMFHLIIN